MTLESTGSAHQGPATERWILSPSMQLEELDAHSATIYLESAGSRVRISRSLYTLLLAFEESGTIVPSTELSAGAARALEGLRAKGFLVPERELGMSIAPRPTRDPPLRLFDCPAQKIVSAHIDVAVLGVPYDLGDRSAAGARHGPAAIRQTSFQLLYKIDRRTGRPHGWFDVDRGRPVLRGITIGDCGDILVDHGERQANVLGRISEVLKQVTRDGALPVLLGGDVSICFPAIEMLQLRAPLAVIRFDGVVQDAAATVRRPALITPASLPLMTIGLPRLEKYVQIGSCTARTAAIQRGADRFTRLSTTELKESGAAALARHLTDGQRVYLGLGMNALQTLARDDDAQGRFTYEQMHSLIHDIGVKYSIVGLDLIRLNPLHADHRVASMTAVHLLIAALSAAKDQP